MMLSRVLRQSCILFGAEVILAETRFIDSEIKKCMFIFCLLRYLHR